MRRDALYSTVRRDLWAVAAVLFFLGCGPTFAQETVLYSFKGGSDGAVPLGALIRSSTGSLFGTTSEQGGCGTVFELDTTGQEVPLYSFTCGTDGANPQAGLVRDAAGNLFGTTVGGGRFGEGTVFEVDTTGKETVLYSFTGGADGAEPWGGLIRDAAGSLYGTTFVGGNSGLGTVFMLDVAGNETALYSFAGGADGALPMAGLVRDAAGNLYGTTVGGGGTGNAGTVFSVDTSGKEAVLYRFTGGVDGAIPQAGLIRDSVGNLYGTAFLGGELDYGTVFKLETSGALAVLHTFTGGSDGAKPGAGLILDAAGDLYGTTSAGGASGSGTVFEVDKASNEIVLYSFAGGTDGADPAAGLIQDAAGNFYGTTGAGGAYGFGTVFEVQAPPGPAVQFTPTYLVFPGSGSTLPLTVTNSGTAPLTITLPQAFSGFNSYDFAVATGTTCTNGTIVAPGGSCIINVTFNPLTTSAESAVLSVFDDANDSPQTVPLSGGAQLASLSPDPVPGSKSAQVITLTGMDFETGAVLNWQDLTDGTNGSVPPLSLNGSEITASKTFANATAAWQFQVANPDGSLSNWYSFEVLGSQYAYVEDDYPFQNATIDGHDPYGFLFRECTSYLAWRMNRDAGTTDPSYPYFFNTMDGRVWGNANNWYANALALGYKVDNVAQVGAIAQWVSGCGKKCSNGHVAYVEQVNQQDGSIVVSEYNFPEEGALNHQFNVRTIAASSKVPPQHFIHVLYLKLSTDLLNFGNQVVGTPSSLPVTVTNPTSESIPVTGIAIAGGNKGDFTQTNTCGSTIPPSGGCQITVTFTPTAQGPRSAIVNVRDTAGTPIKETITLMGAGT